MAGRCATPISMRLTRPNRSDRRGPSWRKAFEGCFFLIFVFLPGSSALHLVQRCPCLPRNTPDMIHVLFKLRVPGSRPGFDASDKALSLLRGLGGPNPTRPRVPIPAGTASRQQSRIAPAVATPATNAIPIDRYRSITSGKHRDKSGGHHPHRPSPGIQRTRTSSARHRISTL